MGLKIIYNSVALHKRTHTSLELLPVYLKPFNLVLKRLPSAPWLTCFKVLLYVNIEDISLRCRNVHVLWLDCKSLKIRSIYCSENILT